jgi:hypothetical protein
MNLGTGNTYSSCNRIQINEESVGGFKATINRVFMLIHDAAFRRGMKTYFPVKYCVLDRARV